MCGVGFVRLNERCPYVKQLPYLRSLLEIRGPDDFRILKDDENLLLFSRLSIRELDSGSQPFTDEETGFISVINGELYDVNTFIEILCLQGLERSHLPLGDMQLLGLAISRFGPRALSWARGMFAGYVLRKNLKDVVVFRDRVGEKPLYFFLSNESFLISSTPLIESETIENRDQIKEALFYGHFENGLGSNNWKQVTPGTYLVIDLETAKISLEQKYWSWNVALKKRHEDLTLASLKSLIQNSVQLQLVADQPICTFLSGGIDSSVITKFARDYYGSGLTAFTLAFSESRYSEDNLSRLAAKKIGVNHEVISVSNSELASNIDECMNFMSLPIFDSGCLSLFTLCKELPSTFRVALSGDGGDELFGGYVLAQKEHWFNFVRRMPRPIRNLMSHLLRSLPVMSNSYLSPTMKLRRAADVIQYEKFSISEIGLSPIAGTHLLPKLVWSTNLPAGGRRNVSSYYREVILPEVYLQKSDRMGLAKSIEIRSPFLDHQLIDNIIYTQRFPKEKEVLKNIASEFLPSEVLNARKHGFSAPISRILPFYPKPKWDLLSIGVSNQDADRVWREAIHGDENNAIAAWALLTINKLLSK